MEISSTEFQQNVGFYLKMADTGKTVNIKRLKPFRADYKLELSKGVNAEITKNIRKNRITGLIKQLDIKAKNESGLNFQKRVRS